MNVHKLKTWPEPFRAVWYGIKGYEVRQNDRNYKVGDVLVLREYMPDLGVYTGREILADVSYMTPGGQWGLPDDLCVLSIRVNEKRKTS